MPKRREKGKKHLIRTFTDFQDSVSHYMYNLNTHVAYKNFRQVRAKHLHNKPENSIEELANTLVLYSEQGQVYIDKVLRVIDDNQLAEVSLKFQQKIYTKDTLAMF